MMIGTSYSKKIKDMFAFPFGSVFHLPYPFRRTFYKWKASWVGCIKLLSVARCAGSFVLKDDKIRVYMRLFEFRLDLLHNRAVILSWKEIAFCVYVCSVLWCIFIYISICEVKAKREIFASKNELSLIYSRALWYFSVDAGGNLWVSSLSTSDILLRMAFSTQIRYEGESLSTFSCHPYICLPNETHGISQPKGEIVFFHTNELRVCILYGWGLCQT
jgi:hypothetical protein